MPIVSVIVPVHNVASCLEESVHSVMMQDMKDIEIILVENLSTDNSYEICEKLASEDDRIKILRIDKADLSSARNAGIEIAESEYVGFIDGDDIIEHGMFSSLYAAIRKFNADIAICNYVLEYPDGKKVYPYPETGEIFFFNKTQMLSRLLTEKVCSSACVMLCRKDIVRKVKFPEFRYYEDHATTYLLVNEAENGCVHVDRTYYHYKQRGGSICYTPDFRKIYDYATGNLERIRFIEEYRGSGSSPEFDKDTKKKLLQHNIGVFANNIVSAIRLVENEEDKRCLMNLRSYIPSLLAYGVLEGKTKSRLLRMRYLWPLFYRSHRKKRKICDRPVP